METDFERTLTIWRKVWTPIEKIKFTIWNKIHEKQLTP
jgi:hypothetical protein